MMTEAQATPRRQAFPDSSNVEAITYDEENQWMEIEFKNGGAYTYESVPADVWRAALKAESIGKFIASSIRGKYRSYKSPAKQATPADPSSPI